jgi:hypothetical protein
VRLVSSFLEVVERRGYVSEKLCRRCPAEAERLDLCQCEGDRDRKAMLTSALDWCARASTIIAPRNGAVSGVH